ncbi:MAG: Uma2 family endonuclease [Methylohalobius sp. ZOD2]
MPLAEAESKLTYADYLTWPDDERWELIEGVPYSMAPAPTRRHQEMVGEIYRQFANQLEDRRCRVYVAPFDVRLSAPDAADSEIDTVLQPDVSVFCDPDRLDDRGAKGAPDLVVEVLSPATAAKDLTVKREVYSRHGVREYWVLEPVDRVLMIWQRQGDSQSSGGETFGAPEIRALEDVAVSEAVTDLHLDLDRLASILEVM